MKKFIKRLLQFVLPQRLFLVFYRFVKKNAESEIELLKHLCKKDSISIDIGADDGIYLAQLYKLSKYCYAFEPRHDAKIRLDKMFSRVKNIKIFEIALSNYVGTANMQVLLNDVSRSTIHTTNDLSKEGNVINISIKTSKLDEIKIADNVAFIKIDVEGHELEVLEGAKSLLLKNHPTLMIEIEERHRQNSINLVTSYLRKLGYSSYFYLNGYLNKIDNFDLALHQNISKIKSDIYLNNFIFIYNSLDNTNINSLITE